MKYARVLDDVVQEVFIEPEGFTIDECFTPQVVVLFEPCADDVETGWVRVDRVLIAPSNEILIAPDDGVLVAPSVTS